MLNVKKDLESYQNTLIRIPSEVYSDFVTFLPKHLGTKKICYVTLNKTYFSLKERFEKEKIDNLHNIVYIDAITKSMSKIEKNTVDCYFVSSPQSLTELSIVINEFLKHGIDYLIFDSLTTLLVYQKIMNPVIKFVTNVANNIKKNKSKGVFYVLNTEEHRLFIEESSMIMDNVVKIEEPKKIVKKNC